MLARALRGVKTQAAPRPQPAGRAGCVLCEVHCRSLRAGRVGVKLLPDQFSRWRAGGSNSHELRDPEAWPGQPRLARYLRMRTIRVTTPCDADRSSLDV